MNARTILTTLSRLCAALCMLLALPAPAVAEDDDPDLKQKLPDLPIVHGERVLDAGHVDMGPKYDDGTWRFLIHDDVARADADAESVWRYPAETVLHVLDEAQLSLPDDPAYAFTGAKAGDPVWVVPQTQNPAVVWLGWNTQDPEVMQTIDRGVTLSLTGAQGPGVVTVYLQSGSFGEPQVLWDSRKTEAQPAWVDVNTHTHANWVFTKPGVYLLRLRADADLIDGTHVSDTQFIRFAVGSSTSTDDALTATWSGADEPTDDRETDRSQEPHERAGDDSGLLVPILVGAIIAVAVALIAGFTSAIVRGNRARRQVLATRGRAPDGEDIE